MTDLPYTYTAPDGDDTGSSRKAEYLEDDPARLARAVARLDAESREQHHAQESLGRAVESLRGELRSLQAAIRGVGKELREHAEAHLAYVTDVEARLQRLEGHGDAGADG